MLKYAEVHKNELIETKVELEMMLELYYKMREENEAINKENGDLIERFTIMEMRAEGFVAAHATEKEKRVVAKIELEKTIVEHAVEVKKNY